MSFFLYYEFVRYLNKASFTFDEACFHFSDYANFSNVLPTETLDSNLFRQYLDLICDLVFMGGVVL